jgi:HK97 family phage prohead protease
MCSRMETSMDRVFGNLQIKTIDEDQRIGAEFDLPIPFLLDHDHSEAVGEVEAAEVTATGIRFRARIKKISEPGLAKDLVDRAWHLLKAGLRKSTSIGFRPLDREPTPSGGWRFLRWEWLELSACAVPCNPEARITGLKRAPLGPRGVDRASKGHVLRLTKGEILRGKWDVEAEQMLARRKRLGIPNPVIKLTAAELVDARLKLRREERAAAKRKPLASKVSIRR